MATFSRRPPKKQNDSSRSNGEITAADPGATKIGLSDLTPSVTMQRGVVETPFRTNELLALIDEDLWALLDFPPILEILGQSSKCAEDTALAGEKRAQPRKPG